MTFLVVNEVASETTVGFLMPSSGLGDQSFNDMTYSGLIQAKQRDDFRLIREQCTSVDDSPRLKMEALLDRGADIVIANGWEFTELVEEFAKKNPESLFLLNDIPVTGFSNIVSTVFGQHEGAFLAGALAAMMSENDHVGFVGGADMPVIRAFYVGYEEGVKFIDKNIKISIRFIQESDSSVSGFNNPAVGKREASTMYDQGVDIIFSVAGLSGNGVIRAAAEKKMFVIGVDANQDHMAKGYVLTSVIKRLDTAVDIVLGEIFANKFQAGVRYFDLTSGGVGLSPMEFTRDVVPHEIHKRLLEIQQNIIDGKIMVTNYLNPSNTNPNKSEFL